MLEILSFLSLTVLVGFKLGPVFAEASIIDEICKQNGMQSPKLAIARHFYLLSM